MLDAVHPVLFKIGALLLPSYGVMAAVGVLLALLLAQRTAHIVRLHPQHIWNLCVLALCAGLIASRLLLIATNWRDLLRHPAWLLGIAMVHNPLVASAGALAGLLAAAWYARAQNLQLRPVLDAMAAPVALAAACEQVGGLLAGSGYGTEAGIPWAVTYTSVLAGRWSGTPLLVPLHPVQAYAALGFFTLAVVSLLWLPAVRQQGDVAAAGLMGGGIVVFITELWRDPEGRGSILAGALDVPQIAAVVMVLAGAVLLRQTAQHRPIPPQGDPQRLRAEDVEAHSA